MFSSRIYSSLARIFRLRSRRSAKDSASSGLPPNSYLPLLSQPEPVHAGPTPSAAQSRTIFTQSPSEPATLRSPPTPVLVIGQDTIPSTAVPHSPIPVLSGNVGRQADVTALETPPVRTQLNTAPLSSHVQSARTADPSDHLPSPSSTLGPIEEENVASRIAPLIAGAPALGGVGGAKLGNGLDDGVRAAPGRGRAATFYSPVVAQPARPQKRRFSLPNSLSGHKTTRRGSSASTLTPSMAGSDSTQKEKRASRLSKELNKPEMQMALSILRSL